MNEKEIVIRIANILALQSNADRLSNKIDVAVSLIMATYAYLRVLGLTNEEISERVTSLSRKGEGAND